MKKGRRTKEDIMKIIYLKLAHFRYFDEDSKKRMRRLEKRLPDRDKSIQVIRSRPSFEKPMIVEKIEEDLAGDPKSRIGVIKYEKRIGRPGKRKRVFTADKLLTHNAFSEINEEGWVLVEHIEGENGVESPYPAPKSKRHLYLADDPLIERKTLVWRAKRGRANRTEWKRTVYRLKPKFGRSFLDRHYLLSLLKEEDFITSDYVKKYSDWNLQTALQSLESARMFIEELLVFKDVTGRVSRMGEVHSFLGVPRGKEIKGEDVSDSICSLLRMTEVHVRAVDGLELPADRKKVYPLSMSQRRLLKIVK